MKVNQIENNLDYLEYVETKGNEAKITLLVEGIHCGACVWLIENTLKKQQEVTNARVNLSTNRLALGWVGDKELISDLIPVIEKLGYKATPFAADQMLARFIGTAKRFVKTSYSLWGSFSASDDVIRSNLGWKFTVVYRRICKVITSSIDCNYYYTCCYIFWLAIF
ncbi:MAG: cation transporter [Candidatus Midichloria mitochondrii]|nr:cation transporter [Candidatus Midichloria mitochondrii]MDJ1288427.1 cation transporter [Candidatus Midichloria mitochondrii]MDJ1299289.1 cation transporter [Candidatus Midichloria mitochondrii]MDJ1312635.1 cation transporter [Candidatus Midichloria mitochondrii]